MHFKLLVAVNIPAMTEDQGKNQEIQDAINLLEQKKAGQPKNIMDEIRLQELRGKVNTFSRSIYRYVADVMEPYCEEPYDPKYITFIDRTEDLKADFSKKVVCFRLAEGKIVEYYSYPYYQQYSIRDGKVYQREAGPLKHEKRTKRAKRIAVLPEYPRARLYKSFEDYAENYRGYDFDSEHGAYGYYCNPNAMWDWYQIGGRWPDMFLVKDTCVEYSPGERSWCNENEELNAPKGYIWVSAARKKDIAWQEMRDWRNQRAAIRFEKLEKMFASGKVNPDFRGIILEDGIMQWGVYIYHKEDTREMYLEKHGIPTSWRYPIGVHDFADTTQWRSRNGGIRNTDTGESLPVDWHEYLDDYIDALDEDTVLVGVDYHM